MPTRTADFAIDRSFLLRRSPRAMSGAPLPRAELLRLLEAARWAPSSSNHQPWRFVLTQRDTPAFSAVHGVLAAGNKAWTAQAAALIVVCAETVRTTSTGERAPRRLAAFDAGAAWMSLALQGTAQGLVVHCLEGFDHAACRAVVRAPADVDVLAVVAVGLPGDPALLTEQWQRDADASPNGRRPLSETVVDDAFSS